MDIKKARKMLDEYKAQAPECTCSESSAPHEPACLCEVWRQRQYAASGHLARQAPATLAAYILAVEALSCDRVVMSPCRKVRPEVETWCATCKALAAWEKL